MPRLNAVDTARRKLNGNGAEFVEALARGLEVIRAFGRARSPMTLSEVARRTGLSKPTARRMLLTLSETGYLDMEGNTFRPAPGLLSLAMAYLGTDLVTTVLQPTCERVRMSIGDACFVAVMDGLQIVMIANSNRSFPLGVVPSIGLRLPAISTAAGRIMLSTLPDEELERHLDAAKPENATGHTETDKSRLRDIILRCRADGFAITRQEAVLGFCAVAMPLKRIDGKLFGALCITQRVDPSSTALPMTDAMVDVLRRETAALSTQLI